MAPHKQGGALEYSRITADGFGNLYVTGSFSDSIIFGSDTLYGNGAKEIFIAKFDGNGNALWLKSIGGICNDYPGDIFISADTALYITGSVCDTARFGAQFIDADAQDIFLARYDNSGNLSWVKGFYGTGDNTGISVKTDSSGNLRCTGRFRNTVTFDSVTLTSAGTVDGFLIKTNFLGNVLWAQQFGAASADLVKDLAVAKGGDAYLTGIFYNAADFDTIALADTVLSNAYDNYGGFGGGGRKSR